jgi:hypothetical protein
MSGLLMYLDRGYPEAASGMSMGRCGKTSSRTTYLCINALLLSSLVASVLIMVVIFPTLWESRARPLRRRDLRKIAPITCHAKVIVRKARNHVWIRRTAVRTDRPVVIVTENARHEWIGKGAVVRRTHRSYSGSSSTLGQHRRFERHTIEELTRLATSDRAPL